MVSRVNGSTFPAEFAGKNRNFFTLRTTLPIMPTGAVAAPTDILTFTMTETVRSFFNGLGSPTFPSVDLDLSVAADVTRYNVLLASQKRFEAALTVVSVRANPDIIGAVKTTTETAPADLPALAGSGTVYTLKFVIEADRAWEIYNPGSFLNANLTLPETLNSVQGFVYNAASPASNNVSVVMNDLL